MSIEEMLCSRFILIAALVVFVTDKIMSKILCCLLCRLAQGRAYLREDDGDRRRLHDVEPDSPRTPQPTLI